MQNKNITTEFWRQPSANTLLYMPLNWDLLDYSWNNNNWTASWTISFQTVWNRQYAQLDNSAISLTSFPVWTWTPNSHTVAWWVKMSSSWVCSAFYMWTDSNWRRYNLVFNYWTSSFMHIMDCYWNPDVPLSSSMWSRQYAWQWACFIYTRNKSTWYHTLYLNNVQTWTSNVRTLNIWTNFKYIWRALSWAGAYWLAEIVFENWVRTAEQRQNFFDKTKSKFWY